MDVDGGLVQGDGSGTPPPGKGPFCKTTVSKLYFRIFIRARSQRAQTNAADEYATILAKITS